MTAAVQRSVADGTLSVMPGPKEMRALELFVSQDGARPHLCTVWRYLSEGGATFVATDGHTLAVRRAGAHRTMTVADIDKLDHKALADVEATPPPAWASVCHRPAKAGKVAEAYGFNTFYAARVGEIEKAAGQRAANDWVPSPSDSKKRAAEHRSFMRSMTFARWMISSDPLDGWYWTINTAPALWEGIIMPRRV